MVGQNFKIQGNPPSLLIVIATPHLLHSGNAILKPAILPIYLPVLKYPVTSSLFAVDACIFRVKLECFCVVSNWLKQLDSVRLNTLVYPLHRRTDEPFLEE